MSISDSRILQLALERLESEKRDIDAEIAELTGRQDNSRIKRRGRRRKRTADEDIPSNSGNGTQVKKKMFAQVVC